MTDTNKETVVVVGASPNPERYSNKAVRALLDHGHKVIPIHPAVKEVCGIPVVASLEEIEAEVDTVTLYVNAAQSSNLQESLLNLLNLSCLYVQRRHTLLRNFGIVAQLRYFLESIGPEMRQYL